MSAKETINDHSVQKQLKKITPYKGEYIWKIPSITTINKYLLCCGYIRHNCSKYIINPLIKLFSDYYTNDEFTLNSIKNAFYLETFLSNIFSIGPIKWYLELNPNGCNDRTRGDIILFICLTSIPSEILSLSISYSLSLIETNTLYFNNYTFKNSKDYSGWKRGVIKLNKIKSLNSLTFKVTININHIHYKDNNNKNAISIIPNNLSLTFPFKRFMWEINDNLMNKIKKTSKNLVTGYSSPIFNAFSTKFYIGFWCNGSRVSRNGSINIFLNLTSIRSLSISYIMRFKLLLVETRKQHTFSIEFSKDLTCCGETDWILKTNDIYKYNSLRIVVEMSLIDIYEDNQTVTDTLKLVNDNEMLTKAPLECQYTWNIYQNTLKYKQNVSYGHSFRSNKFKMFNMFWFIELFPNGGGRTVNNQIKEGNVNLVIHNISLSSNSNSACILSIKYVFIVKETNTKKIGVAIFSKEKSVVSWGTGRILTSNFLNLNHCTVTLNMELVDVYDKGVNVTTRFIEEQTT